MSKRIVILLAAIFLLATSASALNLTDNGTQHIELCYITDMGQMTSGDVVILQTSSPTYWGREVTGTTSQGLHIFGVCLDTPTRAQCAAGTWIRVQTSGYCPIVKMGKAVTANESMLCTDNRMFRATGHEESSSECGGSIATVTGSSVVLETKRDSGATGTETVKAFLRCL